VPVSTLDAVSGRSYPKTVADFCLRGHPSVDVETPQVTSMSRAASFNQSLWFGFGIASTSPRAPIASASFTIATPVEEFKTNSQNPGDIHDKYLSWMTLELRQV